MNPKKPASFSERHGLVAPDSEIAVTTDAPPELRAIVPRIADGAGFDESDMRSLLCRLLYRVPDKNNWSPPNVEWEVQGLMEDCSWNEVYDVIERIHEALTRRDRDPFHPQTSGSAQRFSDEMNRYFRKRGIGWKLENGLIEVRGAEAFELVVQAAKNATAQVGLKTASNEIHEALRDLSRRPSPDRTGAVQHGIAALEIVARHMTGDSKSNLGGILKKNPTLFPPPLGEGLELVWAFASERGRHLREGREPEALEVELVVGLACSAATYLARKMEKA